MAIGVHPSVISIFDRFLMTKMRPDSINKFTNSNISSIALQWYADQGKIRRSRGVMIKTSCSVALVPCFTSSSQAPEGNARSASGTSHRGLRARKARQAQEPAAMAAARKPLLSTCFDHNSSKTTNCTSTLEEIEADKKLLVHFVYLQNRFTKFSG